MLTHESFSAAEPEAAWALVAQPARWHEWAPHLRGAWRLGDPQVEDSALGVVFLFGVIPVPARVEIVAASAERRHWVWKVGPMKFDHVVRTVPGGCMVSISVRAPWPLEQLIATTYWPYVGWVIDRWAEAAQGQGN